VTIVSIRTNQYIACSLLFFSSQSDVTNSYREAISCVVNTRAQIELAQRWSKHRCWIVLKRCDERSFSRV